MSPPLIIEFAGVPGSGKSSLSDLVAAKLRSEGREVRTVIDAARVRSAESGPGRLLKQIGLPGLTRTGLWWIFYSASSLRAIAVAWKSRRAIIELAAYQARRPIPFRLKAHIAWWFLQLGGRRSYLQTSRSIDAVLFDDGYVHRSVALFSSPTERPLEQTIRRYIANIPAPSVVIQVSAPVNTCAERVMRRGIWSHSSDMTGTELRQYLSSAQNVLEIAIDEARINGVQVLSVINDEAPIDDTASRIAENLGGLLDAASTGRMAS